MLCRSGLEEVDEFRPPPQMQEIIISFLTRMAFLLGDAAKDPDFQVCKLIILYKILQNTLCPRKN